MRIVAYIMALSALSTSVVVSAHSGGLNAEGCHNNRKTGDYPAIVATRLQRPSSALNVLLVAAMPITQIVHQLGRQGLLRFGVVILVIALG